MPSSEIIAYAREQLAAGFTPQEIAAELARQGWTPQEIAETFEAAGPQHQGVSPPVQLPSSRKYLLALAGGILLFAAGLGMLLGLGSIAMVMAELPALIRTSDAPVGGVLGVVLAILLVVGGILLKGSHKRLGGILAVVCSLLGIIGFGSLLALAGGILGLAGAVLALRATGPGSLYPPELASVSLAPPQEEG